MKRKTPIIKKAAPSDETRRRWMADDAHNLASDWLDQWQHAASVAVYREYPTVVWC